VKLFLPGDRTVRYWSSATDGPIVLFFHGCPDTRRIAMTGAAAAEDAGVRLLAFNRPGYGSSTPAASTHTSVAHLAAEILDVWGIDQVAVLGMSVGGSYAAAFAASHPGRTTSLGLVSAQAMVETDSEGTVEDAVERLRPEFMAWRAKIDPDDEDDAALASRLLAELPESDAVLLRAYDDEFVAYLAFESLVKPEGYLRDAALLFRTWDFDPAAISCPVSLWVGDQDEPAVAASAWWCQRLPQAKVEVLAHTTHLAALVGHWPAILTRLGTGAH
jgi:pimeloyl-ACP methyl ester carboxylesterase